MASSNIPIIWKRTDPPALLQSSFFITKGIDSICFFSPLSMNILIKVIRRVFFVQGRKKEKKRKRWELNHQVKLRGLWAKEIKKVIGFAYGPKFHAFEWEFIIWILMLVFFSSNHLKIVFFIFFVIILFSEDLK